MSPLKPIDEWTNRNKNIFTAILFVLYMVFVGWIVFTPSPKKHIPDNTPDSFNKDFIFPG